jgi:hypothetical protein
MFRLLVICLLLSTQTGILKAMELTSPDIKEGATIAKEHIYMQCVGTNVSPALSWRGVPPGTNSLALTMLDPDARPSGWSHWLVVGLPPKTASLAKGASSLPPGAKVLRNDFGAA